jgi:hypothetical protein
VLVSGSGTVTVGEVVRHLRRVNYLALFDIFVCPELLPAIMLHDRERVEVQEEVVIEVRALVSEVINEANR